MKLTIVGLGPLGLSLGLALKAADAEIDITGHDPEPAHVARAKGRAAIDRSHWNLISACDGADLVFLDLDQAETAKTMAALAPELGPRTTLIETAPVKRPLVTWAEAHLPTGGYVGARVVPRGDGLQAAEPAAERLRGAAFLMVTARNTASFALDAAANLAEAVGAAPRYMDAVEHDGVVAGTSQAPRLVAAALLAALQAEAGWDERREAFGREFLAGCALLASVEGDTAAGSARAAVDNADNLVRWLDACGGELALLRRLLAEGEAEALEQALRAARRTAAAWLAPDQEPDMIETESLARAGRFPWRQWLLGGLFGPQPRG